jgi:hypothetical protein
MTFTATQALNDAMLSGGIDGFLDADPVNPAYAILYDASAVALVTMLFARPAATLVAHALVFQQGNPLGDFIGTQGSAVSFELYSGAGVLGGSGDVSSMAGTGALKVSGTTDTLLYQGARAILGSLKFA